jgi:lipid-A-disaccharide synthase
VDRAISGEKRILLVTGEASGDLHAARLVQALRSLGPVRVRGIAGPALRAAGVESILPAEELAMVGFSEVLAKLPRILAARGKLLEEWRSFAPPCCWWTIRLQSADQTLSSRRPRSSTIAPQIWAWHRARAR